MPGRLAGKNAIVTGAGAGIGRAISELFGREGAYIALFDINSESAQQTHASLSNEGIESDAYCVDVTDPKQVNKAMADLLAKRNGVIHVLVNNAGIAEFANVEHATLTSWQNIMSVNVNGTFLCSQAVLPHMKQSGGVIINMASIAGLIGIPGMPAYCASKAAVIGLTRQMAADYTNFGIRINCLCPGRIAGTDLDRWIMSIDSESTTHSKIAKYPVGRFGQPEEVAQFALFLATDDSGFISGSTLCIDGGLTAI